MKTDLQILREARELISEPEHWGRFKFMGDQGGSMCYCAMGALSWVVRGQSVPLDEEEIEHAQLLGFDDPDDLYGLERSPRAHPRRGPGAIRPGDPGEGGDRGMRRRDREKRVIYRESGMVDRLMYLVHREEFSIELHLWEVAEADPVFHSRGAIRVDGIEGARHWVAGGVEVHSRVAMYGDKEADHQCCNVLGGPCWHDGSSLAASEFFEYWHGDDECAFGLCESWARSETERRGADREETEV